MALTEKFQKMVSPEKAQSLSNRAVFGLALCMGIVCLVLIWTTLGALIDAGQLLAAFLVMLPLAKGLSHYCAAVIRYCRPDWFMPESPGEPG